VSSEERHVLPHTKFCLYDPLAVNQKEPRRYS